MTPLYQRQSSPLVVSAGITDKLNKQLKVLMAFGFETNEICWVIRVHPEKTLVVLDAELIPTAALAITPKNTKDTYYEPISPSPDKDS